MAILCALLIYSVVGNTFGLTGILGQKKQGFQTRVVLVYYESDTKFIEDIHGGHTSCAIHFAKETGPEHSFGDHSK